mgnify:CR=1 FL=1
MSLRTMNGPAMADHLKLLGQSRIAWVDVAAGLPDSDETVMVYSATEDEPVWLGYHDGAKWRSVAGEPWDVEAWGAMPDGPVNGCAGKQSTSEVKP